MVETDDKELAHLALLTRYKSLKFGVLLILDRLILFVLSNLLPHLLPLLNANFIEYPQVARHHRRQRIADTITLLDRVEHQLHRLLVADGNPVRLLMHPVQGVFLILP